jgi:hypothetical protein
MDMRILQRSASCQACVHSVAHPEGLWCWYWDRESKGLCDAYQQSQAQISVCIQISDNTDE